MEERAVPTPKLLIGNEVATIDDKGRLLVSKKKRERLGDDFVAGLGTVGCIVLYPEATWQAICDEIFRYPSLNQGREQYARLVMGYAYDDLKFDPQNRVVIPAKLRELARIGDKERVLVFGMGDRVEIWSAREWEIFERTPDTYGRDRRDSLEAAYRKMTGVGTEQ